MVLCSFGGSRFSWHVDGDDDDDDEPYYMLSQSGVSNPLASYDDDQILTAQEKWLGDH